MRPSLFVVVAAISAVSAADDSRADPAGEQTWKNVVYLGGVPGVRVEHRDLEQTLTVTSSGIVVRVHPLPADPAPGKPRTPPRVLFEIPRGSIAAATHLGFRHDMPNAQAWIGLPGHWPKATDHLIVLNYRLSAGPEAEVLLRVDKKHFQEILDTLRSRLQ
jgi:hypothetical protein